MIEVKYYYSACISIKTKDLSILCDPWFTEGVYDGSWFHYPPVNNPMGFLEKYEFIYISHIHPDHYDPVFLKQYITRYPDTKILISEYETNYLSFKMKSDNIPYEIVKRLNIGGTSLEIFPQGNVDSALAIKVGDQSVVNLNDSWYNEVQFNEILAFTGSPDIALLSHAGAGAYPQTYFNIGEELLDVAQWKHGEMLKRYKKMCKVLKPKVAIPFAGQYILGGKVQHLNKYRGVSDAVEVLEFDNQAVVLATGAKINTKDLIPSNVRTEKYSEKDIYNYALSLSSRPMDYEVAFSSLDESKVNWERMLNKSYQNALSKYIFDTDTWQCICLKEQWYCMKLNKSSPESRMFTREEVEELTSRTEIYIDYRHLFGLLSLYYHWNNAEIGSHYHTRRIPNVYNPEVQVFLNFFHM